MVCSSCGKELSPEARFCAACGSATREARRAVRTELRDQRVREDRAAWLLAWIFGGSLFAVFAPTLLPTGELFYSWEALGLTAGIDLVVFGVAAFFLAPAARAQIWGSHVGRPGDYARALGLGLACFAVAACYAWLLNAGLLPGDSESGESIELMLPLLLAIVVAAPLLEEMLCRGVAWQAALGLGGPRLAIVLTAILFAVLHGANGGFVLEFPHRFLGGLALGWLRWKSDALAPCVFLHFVWNTAAVATMS